MFKKFNKSYKLFFADSDINNIDNLIPEKSKLAIPKATDNNFLKELSNLCKMLSIDFLIPSVDEELLQIAKNKEKFLPSKIILPNYKFITLTLNKFNMIKFLSGKQIKTPKTYLLGEDIKSSNFSIPSVVKPIYGRGSKGIFYARNFEELKKIKIFLQDSHDQYISQEQIFGTEYTVQMIANHKSQLKSIVPVKIISKKGITIRAVIDNNEKIIDFCSIVHEALPTFGIYNIQLMLSNEGIVFPFEINPRISTTFCLVCSALNKDILELIYEESNTNDKIIKPKSGIRLKRNWKNEIY